MATPEYESIIYFPFGGQEYKDGKNHDGAMGLITKSIEKIKAALERQEDATDLIIVAHGKEKHSPGRDPKIYSEPGWFGTVSRKSANDLVVKLRNGLGTSFNKEKIKAVYLWVCYSSTSGLGATISEALSAEELPVYATPQAIGGAAYWNTKCDGTKDVGQHSFVLVPRNAN